MHRPSVPSMAVAVCAALALTACSGSSDSPDSAEPSPNASASTAPPADAQEDANAETSTDDDAGGDAEADDGTEENAGAEAGEDDEPQVDGGATDPAEEEDEYGAALQERDQFLEDQQLPLDGSPLEATTPEQQEFIDTYREYVEGQGGTWNAEIETVTLALSLDACESAILAFHDVDEQEVATHILSSPLFDSMIPPELSEQEREGIEADLASTMVYGIQYLCPDDHEQWETVI